MRNTTKRCYLNFTTVAEDSLFIGFVNAYKIFWMYSSMRNTNYNLCRSEYIWRIDRYVKNVFPLTFIHLVRRQFQLVEVKTIDMTYLLHGGGDLEKS